MRRSLLHRFLILGMSALGAVTSLPAHALDLSHAAWDTLLRKHVQWNPAGVASSVAYKGFQADRAELKKVLDEYSAVTRAQYEALSKDDRLAFLVNVYNAFTIELILGKYPDLKSIKDLGSLIQAPWRRKFFRLLGEERHLDNIEHDMIRAPGAFDEPRIHFVVVCASIGCPALRPEAVTGAKVQKQLEDSARRFLADRSRNRYNATTGRLEVSKIFDWYKGDFEKGHMGVTSREVFFGRYAEQLAPDGAGQQLVREGKVPITFLDYDWTLNDRR